MGLAQTDTVAHSKFWGSLLKKYGPTAARLAGHAIKAYMGLAQTSSAAQEKFWGSLLRKYGPTAAKLAGHAIKAYMGLAQTSTTAVQKEKWLGMALKAAHMGYNLWKATRLAETSSASKLKFGWFKAIKKYGPTAIKLAGQAYHAYNNAAQTSAAAKEGSWWSHAIKAATHAVKTYGPTAIKMAKAGYHAYNSAQTSADARELSWWRKAISIAKKYGPTAIKMAKAGYKAYNSAQTSAQKNRKR